MSKIKHSSKFLFFQILKNIFIFFCKYLPFTSKFKENLPRRKFEIKTILKFGIGSKMSKIVFELVKGKQRRWTIIALRNLIFYFWSNIELTWHECSFMSQITNYKEKMLKQNFGDLI